jgi:metallo-beta-lactamase family protein
LDGTCYPIRAQVAMIGGYSAHADQSNLLTFVRNMRRWPTQIRIVHGDDAARRALKAKFEEMANQKGRNVEVVLPVAQLL